VAELGYAQCLHRSDFVKFAVLHARALYVDCTESFIPRVLSEAGIFGEICPGSLGEVLPGSWRGFGRSSELQKVVVSVLELSQAPVYPAMGAVTP
jgi:hypothetical protein